MTAAQRAEYLRAYRQSGLNQAAFAKREGLAYSTFCHWVQKAAKGLLRAPAAASAASSISRSGAVQFAQVRLPASMPSPAALTATDAAGVELQLPDGVVVRGADVQKLAALVRALRS